MSQVELIDYSEKAVALFGSNGGDGTKSFREAISSIGGKFNPSLKYGEDRAPGWIFPKSKMQVVEKLVNDINSGKCAESTPVEAPKSSKYTRPAAGSSAESVDRRAFLALVSRVEQLEQELTLVKKQNNMPLTKPTISSSRSVNFQEDDEEDDYEEPPSQPAPRLLKKKT